jgi:Zn-dependent peptidase ImmA (M78 family)
MNGASPVEGAPLSPGEIVDAVQSGGNGALAFRLNLGLGFAPVAGPHLWKIISDLGIALAFEDFGEKLGDGLYLGGESPLIVLNTAKPPLRIRFTAAHELAHHQLHRLVMSQDVYADHDIEDDQYKVIERAANAFAAQFLAPDMALFLDVGKISSRQLDTLFVVRLMQTYGVSYEFLLWRLREIGVLEQADRDRLARADDFEHATTELSFDVEALYGVPKRQLPAEFVRDVRRLVEDSVIDSERQTELLLRKEPAL